LLLISFSVNVKIGSCRVVFFQGSSAVDNGPVSDHEHKPDVDAEREAEVNVESNTCEPSLPPSTAGWVTD